MAVSDEQWAAVAAELELTVEEMHVRIAQVDQRTHWRERHKPLEFDRDMEPITFGQWAFLYESRSYRIIAETMLPNRCWVATIWHGRNDEGSVPPIVMETSVFQLLPDRAALPAPMYQETHANEAEARAAHQRIAQTWAIGFDPKLAPL